MVRLILAAVFSLSHFIRMGMVGALLWISSGVFWPYLAGATILIAGSALLIKARAFHARTWDRITLLGPLFFAIPIAVFGAQHFTAAIFVAKLVPSWIPWHLFWTYFVGGALIAAALSLATGIKTRLAATLLGIMLLLFVLLMHLPNFAKNPHDRFLLAVLLRDLSFSGGAFALAASRTEPWHRIGRHKIATVARFFVAIPLIFFGVENVLHSTYVPTVALNRITPTWIPGHVFWDYLTGIVFVVSGFAVLFQRRARLAAVGAAATVLLVVLFVYLPIVAVNPPDVANGLNFLVDTLLLSGSLLLLADALPKEEKLHAAETVNIVTELAEASSIAPTETLR